MTNLGSILMRVLNIFLGSHRHYNGAVQLKVVYFRGIYQVLNIDVRQQQPPWL